MQALTGLGVLALEQGDPTAARARFDEGLRIAREVADRFSIVQLLAGSASLAAAEGRPERALHLAGAVTALAEAFKLSFLPGVPARLDRGAQRARSAVSGAVAEAAWEAGRTMTLDQAIAYALANEPSAGEPPVEEAAGDRPPPTSQPRTEAYPAGLTPREIEVLRLLAAGQTSREIAAALVVSVATVHRHISNVYGKIGARGRADATAYALTHGVVPARRS
jgi:DNA-binding CsgD family transcriptional regulator